MISTTTIGRNGRFGIGLALLALVAVVVTLQLAAWPSRSLPMASAPASTTNFSKVPAGFSDYANLRTNADRPSYSVAPAGMTDHPAFAAHVNHSTAPAGMTDHPAPAARINPSMVPNGFTDYLSLQPKSRVNPSRIPSGLTDYLSLQPKARVNPSQPPSGMTNHLSPAR